MPDQLSDDDKDHEEIEPEEFGVDWKRHMHSVIQLPPDPMERVAESLEMIVELMQAQKVDDVVDRNLLGEYNDLQKQRLAQLIGVAGGMAFTLGDILDDETNNIMDRARKLRALQSNAAAIAEKYTTELKELNDATRDSGRSPRQDEESRETGTNNLG